MQHGATNYYQYSQLTSLSYNNKINNDHRIKKKKKGKKNHKCHLSASGMLNFSVKRKRKLYIKSVFHSQTRYSLSIIIDQVQVNIVIIKYRTNTLLNVYDVNIFIQMKLSKK